MSLVVQSKDWFKFDGVICDTKGLYCDTPQSPPMARKRFTTYKYGSDEDGVFSDDSFENVRYSLTCYKFPMSQTADFNDVALYAWIQTAKLLEISRNYGYYYKIRTIDGIQPTVRHDGMRIDYKINMTLSPFRYVTNNSEFPLPQDGVIENAGTRYSKPIVRMQVTNAPATITTNGAVLTINTTGQITIDSDRMLVYRTVNGVNEAITQYTQGALPMLSVGTNLMTVSSGISNVSIVGNWRCY